MYSTEFSRDNGDKVRISFTFTGLAGANLKCLHRVHLKPKGKRKWTGIVDTNDYAFRGLNMEQREECTNKLSMKYITQEELQQARLHAMQEMMVNVINKSKCTYI